MNCRQIQDQLSAYIDGELSDDQASRVAAHLETCADCHRLHREIAAVVAELHSLPEAPAPASVAANVMAEVRRTGAAPSGNVIRLNRLVAAAAAVLVAMAGTFVIMTQKAQEPIVGAGAAARARRQAKQRPRAVEKGDDARPRLAPSMHTTGSRTRRITVATNDVSRAREDVLKLAAQIEAIAAQPAAGAGEELHWSLREADYEALLAKLNQAGYQLDRESVGAAAAAADEGGVTAASTQGEDTLSVTIRFRTVGQGE